MIALMSASELAKHRKRIKECADVYAGDNGRGGQPTVERPVSVHLTDTNNNSETALFSTINQAEAAICELATDPTPVTLKRLGFKLTN